MLIVQKLQRSAKQRKRLKINVLVDILSLFPGYFTGPFSESMIKRARENGLVNIRLTDIRDFADNRYHRVDDRPYGGGPGMKKLIRMIMEGNAKTITVS